MITITPLPADGDGAITLALVDLLVVPSVNELVCLTNDELLRAARFRSPVDRRRYRAAHCALRRLIADFTGIAASRLALVDNAWGKPAVADLSGFHFSLSHAGDTALIGLSTSSPIGVDLEPVRVVDDSLDLAAIHFTDGEHEALSAIDPGPFRDLAFLRGWTRKEACVKAIGLGLSCHTAGFESGVDAAPRRVAIAGEDHEEAVELRTIHPAPGLIAAWARVVPDRSRRPGQYAAR